MLDFSRKSKVLKFFSLTINGCTFTVEQLSIRFFRNFFCKPNICGFQIDLISEKDVSKTQKQVKRALGQLNISSETPIVAISLMSPNEDAVTKVVEAIRKQLYVPKRENSGKFVLCVDHCFPIKGKGSVLTGTVVDGSCK